MLINIMRCVLINQFVYFLFSIFYSRENDNTIIYLYEKAIEGNHR